jgi:hypothetical protein
MTHQVGLLEGTVDRVNLIKRVSGKLLLLSSAC